MTARVAAMAENTDTAPGSRRHFLRRSGQLGAAALLPAAAVQAFPTAAPGLLNAYPEAAAVPALKAGGTIAVLAPASPAADKQAAAAAWLRARGFVPRLLPGAGAHSADYLAGSDSARLDDLHAAFADPAVDAVFCLRGGYGSARLLDRIDFNLISDNPKPFVGYSDITALLLAITRFAGFVTFHGPMLVSDLLAGRQAPTETALWQLLQGQRRAGQWLPPAPAAALETIADGTAQGRLLGGNLATIGSTLGTPYEIDLDDAILFIEDVGETPQKIDRLLTQLRLAGKLAQLRGVLIGDFSDINDPRAGTNHDAANRERLRQVWRDLLQPLAIPILAGWPSGHCDPNLTLPIGARVRLDAGRQRLRLEQDVVQAG